MGILSASSVRVNHEVLRLATSWRDASPRRLLTAVGGLLWLAFLLPPMSQWSVRFEYFQSIQFCVFATVVPSFLVMGAPWGLLGATSSKVEDIDVAFGKSPAVPLRFVDRFAVARESQPGRRRAVVLVLLFIALTVLWRSAPVVDALVQHQWLSVVESLSLVPVGVLLWLELIDSPPFKPGTSRPYRIGMVAGSMWTIWVIAYLGAMSGPSWYSAFHYVAGHGVSQAADQQLTAGVMWFLSAAAFLPLVFWNLIQWLQTEEDPNDELYRLVRQERTQGFFGTDS